MGSQITATASVALTLVLLGLIAAMGIAAWQTANRIRSNTALTLFATPDANADMLNTLKKRLGREPAVRQYTFVSADQVLAQEVPYIGDETLALLDENPYGAEFEIRLHANCINADTIAALTKRLSTLPGVDSVASNTASLKSINRTFSRLALIGGIVAAVLLLISFVLINNTVSLSIYSRRFTIRTMRLVGATAGFIRRPFVRAGLTCGLIGGICAAAILCGARAYAGNVDRDIAEALPWEYYGAMTGALVVAGALICSMAAWLSATRYLRRGYDKLYRK